MKRFFVDGFPHYVPAQQQHGVPADRAWASNAWGNIVLFLLLALIAIVGGVVVGLTR